MRVVNVKAATETERSAIAIVVSVSVRCRTCCTVSSGLWCWQRVVEQREINKNLNDQKLTNIRAMRRCNCNMQSDLSIGETEKMIEKSEWEWKFNSPQISYRARRDE